MYKNYSFLAIIPARGGSKGVKRKNIRPLAGKPLIAWTIQSAQQSAYLDRFILSSEDAEIIATARQWGCEVPFIRPAELAQDETAGIEPIIHAIQTVAESYDYVVVLQPTSPLRLALDIDQAIQQCIDQQAEFCVSVTEPDAHPYWCFQQDSQGYLQPLIQDIPPRRQDLPAMFTLNGAVYVAKTSTLLQTRKLLNAQTQGYVMPKSRALDIDTEEDLLLAAFFLNLNQGV
ncbi:cytidylyltransferase domain-containing protein [Beggiatoa leptomitoformis]|uniref:Acylneuraminate cytidylyltransferase family protein n=1 Tax=Beggiatoa leptomitoformis TaxID=288004 RepID=A0A2N9YIE6_9GAMM|nr:acylneuraminate cytidylyltransferase family protein [Beggiatoa leptomitoformis]ALG67631.1 acylneuraminate cytidylyltransferase family protein [Beggiatoa leptomitoformis]AUI70135.1 acylneuraminate cytidylyltransferase family protein [Beggiatoa leptomitoformis]